MKKPWLNAVVRAWRAMPLRKIILLGALLLLVLPAAAQDTVIDTNFVDACVEAYDPDVDYFLEKVEITHADAFTVEYFNNYKLVTILTPWQNADETFEYVLVQCGTPVPEGYDDSQIIEVPVQSIVTMSTSMLPHLDMQGVVDRLVGVDSTLFISTPSVLERVEAGEIAEIGGGGGFGEVNVEVLLELDPDLIMTQQFSPGSGSMSSMQEAGLPVVINSDFVDTSPLGQAEWGKYIALYFNTEAQANEAFEGVVERYEDLTALAAETDERPTVFAASAFQGTWYMPAGDSTVAQLLRDANADYLWSDETGTSIPLDFETVFERAAGADYWVNLNQFWTTFDEALADDERYSDFAVFESGNIYNNNGRPNPNGGNDYFETGVANPDMLLADLIAILHPDLLPDHELIFYRRLE